MYAPIIHERFRLGQYGLDPSDSGGGGFFFEDFEALAVFFQLGGVVNVRAAANFKTKRFVGAIFDHFVDFYGITVTVTKLT